MREGLPYTQAGLLPQAACSCGLVGRSIVVARSGGVALFHVKEILDVQILSYATTGAWKADVLTDYQVHSSTQSCQAEETSPESRYAYLGRKVSYLAFTGQVIALLARLLMGKQRILAVKLLIVSTVMVLAWAIHIEDWPSMWGHVFNIVTSFWTLYCWSRE